MANYEERGREIGRVVDEKNAAYGNSFHEAHRILEVFWPEGIPVEAYPLVMAFTRIVDKMFRLVHQPEAFGENPANDLAGYCLLLGDAQRPANGSLLNHGKRHHDAQEAQDAQNGPSGPPTPSTFRGTAVTGKNTAPF